MAESALPLDLPRGVKSSGDRGDTARGAGARGSLRFFAVSWLLLTALMVSWSLATPLFASPDEPAQIIKAVAVSHGQLTGTTIPYGHYYPFLTGVEIPAYYQESLTEAGCYIGLPDRTPACAPAFDAGQTQRRQVVTWVGRYPPLYYAIVGLPSWVSDGTAAVLAMRMVSAVLCGAFFALGLTGLRSLRQPSGMVAAGWLAITPTALFFGAVVNPSGLEIATAFATWGMLLPLVREPGRYRVTGRLLAAAVTAAVLLNTRPGSGLLVFLIVACLAVAASGAFWRAMRPWRRWLPTAIIAAVAALAAGLWLALVDPTAGFGRLPTPSLDSPLAAMQAAAAASPLYVEEQVGVFGMQNITLYQPVIWLLVGVIGLVTIAALVLGRGRMRWALLLVLIVALALPVVSQIPTAGRLGLAWQGRYGLPVSLGIPLFAMAALVEQPLGARVVRWAAMVAAPITCFVQAVGFGWAFWRYVWGFGHRPFSVPIGWLPPGGWLAPSLFTVADVLLMAVILLQPGSPLRRMSVPAAARLRRRRARYAGLNRR